MISNEQHKIVNGMINNENIIIDAVAGSGKTTTSLHIISSLQKKRILLLTYNTILKEETRHKVKLRGFSNVTVDSYHSICIKHYMNNCCDDFAIQFIVDNNITPYNTLYYDIIILDEAQDLSSLYFKLVQKIIYDNESRYVQLCIIGDIYQNIYKYKGTDYRFMTLADKLYDTIFITYTLSESFRLPINVTNFVNKCMLNTDRIISNKDIDSNVRYIITDPFKTGLLYVEIQRYITCGYTYDDIFILVPSIKTIKQKQYKSRLNPLTKFVNKLSDEGIPIYISKSDSTHNRLRDMKGKVSFLTFHQCKGLERNVIIVYNFDNSYFEFFNTTCMKSICPNELYVAVTRTKAHLTLIHNHNHDYLPFLNINNLSAHCNIVNNTTHTPRCISTKMSSPFVTNIVSHLSHRTIARILTRLKIDTITYPDVKLHIPTEIENDGKYEHISDITGVAIPMYFAYKIGKPHKILRTFTGDIPELLSIIVDYMSSIDCLNYRPRQIMSYTWITDAAMTTAVERLMMHVGNNPQFEVPHKFNSIYGTIDCVDDAAVWEFKCVSTITKEHIMQLAMYMYIFYNTYDVVNKKFYIFNILSGEKLSISSTKQQLTEIYDIIMQTKYNVEIDDYEFLRIHNKLNTCGIHNT